MTETIISRFGVVQIFIYKKKEANILYGLPFLIVSDIYGSIYT